MNKVPGVLEYDTFINSLGDFSKEKSLFKSIARRGQAFSSSIATKDLNIDSEILEIPDIKRDKFTFSDGCGEIDKSFFEEEVLKRYFKHSICSAIQIRMGGYKGVLLATNNLSDGVKVHTRESMNKFGLPTDQTEVNLEVLRLATYMSGYLNKQIILVLWSNNISPKTLLNLQTSYISLLLKFYSFKTPLSPHTSDLLQSFCIIRPKLPSHTEEILTDPFISPIVKRICMNRLRDVRRKFRIFDEFSCNLIGVVDPYGWLREGEVFVQVSRREKYVREVGENEVVWGKVLVTRSPWVHPGDLRILTAVDEPLLCDLVNVIVFSAEGERPDQHKMGSGDLDGDIYWINWRPEFVYNFIEKEPDNDDPEILKEILEPKPMAEESKYRVDQNINREKWIMAFIDHLKKDILGQVAFLHLKVADQGRESLEEKDCKILAKMHWVAVDSAK